MPEHEFVNEAEAAIDRRTEAHAAEHRPPPHALGDERAALRAQQQEEAAHIVAGPGAPAMTSAQARGAVVGMVVGGLIGAVLFLPLAFIPVVDAVAVRLLLAALVGAMAGATAGGIYMGGREPELEGETVDADGRPSVGTTLRDPGTDARGR